MWFFLPFGQAFVYTDIPANFHSKPKENILIIFFVENTNYWTWSFCCLIHIMLFQSFCEDHREKKSHSFFSFGFAHHHCLPACLSLSIQGVAHKCSLPEVLFLVTICVHHVLDQHSASVSAKLCSSDIVQSQVSQVWASVPDKACGTPLLHGKSLFFS